MCEAAEVHGHKYGRPADDIEACLNEGRIGIMTIDHQGAKAMKERFGSRMKAVFLHISKTEQRVRLIERGTDSPESIERRCAAYDVESHGGCDIANLMITNTDKEWTIRRVINYAEGK
jgi:guanylate kinase